MSALAEEIKAAQESVLASPPISEEMLKEAGISKEYAKLQAAIRNAPRAESLQQRLSDLMPTSKEESLSTGLKWGLGLAGISAGSAALLSYLSHLASEKRRKGLIQDLLSAGKLGGIPGREMKLPISVKHAKEDGDDKGDVGKWAPYALGALVGIPAAAWLGSKAWRGLRNIDLPYVKDLFTTTEHPITHPATVPLTVGGSLITAMVTKKVFDKIFENVREKRKQRELASAEREFQRALAEQYSPKAANLNSAIDLLATTHVSGELREQIDSITKQADANLENVWQEEPWYKGTGSGLLGVYLTVLLGLGALGVGGGYLAARRFDKGRKKSEAIERALKRRAMATPPQPITEEQDVSELAEEPV